MSNIINQYGDTFNPIGDGHGVDIASQRQDALDLSSLEFIRQQLSIHQKVQAVDLGGGFGAHSIKMAKLGASVTLIDIADIPTVHFPHNLSFIQKDFIELTNEDIQNNIDVLYSQRAIHYLPYSEAKKLLQWIYSRMKNGGAVFISAAGLKAEYGITYLDRDKPIENRFNYIANDMQQKFNVYQKLVLYSEKDMSTLLTDAGFIDIHVTSSEFGSVKAMARKS